MLTPGLMAAGSPGCGRGVSPPVTGQNLIDINVGQDKLPVFSRSNYIIPGLTSVLLGKSTAGGLIRMFTMNRDQEYEITPHNHRYDFLCHVVCGTVENTTYQIGKTWSWADKDSRYVSAEYDEESHSLNMSEVRYHDVSKKTTKHSAGDSSAWYQMKSHEFHSIRFHKGTSVLFFEGARKNGPSLCLLPFHDGVICDTFLWRDWMMGNKP